MRTRPVASTPRTIKHVSLHRLGKTELRVVADVEHGALPLIDAETQVVTRFAQMTGWPHRTVTLFILSDLAPLQRQLQALGKRPVDSQLDDADELPQRPIVNVYDLASPVACHLFVNQQAMVAAGYWDDLLALKGLFAHEHAHPLAECAATRAVRQVHLTVTLQLGQPWAADAQMSAHWAQQAQSQLSALTRTLVLLGPREVFANEVVLRAGFVEPLLYLNRRNARNLVAGLVHRKAMQEQLSGAVRSGRLTQAGAAALALLGDLHSGLTMAMEIAAFRRQGRPAGEELYAQLATEFFPHLDPVVSRLFQQLCEEYAALSSTASQQAMADYVRRQLDRMAAQLNGQQIQLTYQIEIVP